jgi:hypothetical protein
MTPHSPSTFHTAAGTFPPFPHSVFNLMFSANELNEIGPMFMMPSLKLKNELVET